MIAEEYLGKLIRLEYLLDVENQKSGRKNKRIKEAWGLAVHIKHEFERELPFQQSTLPNYTDKFCRTKFNPTWTEKARKVFVACQNAKQANLKSARGVSS